jgi:hypothetical protein
VSNLPEIKRRLEKLTKLGDRMREQFKRLAGPEGEEAKKKAKESGKRIGIGAGLSFFGLVLASIAGVYVLAVIILVVNIALDRLWLSALIVVGGFLLIGGGIIAAGVSIAGPAAKNLSKAAEDVTNEMKLQVIVKQEAEVRQKQIAEQAKVVAPAVAAGFLAYKVARRKMKSRREKRAILKVIEMYEASRAREED